MQEGQFLSAMLAEIKKQTRTLLVDIFLWSCQRSQSRRAVNFTALHSPALCIEFGITQKTTKLASCYENSVEVWARASVQEPVKITSDEKLRMTKQQKT